MRARGRRATIREVLDTALDLERRTMHFYTALVKVFSDEEELRSFWFAMARHEAGHCGALTLVESLVEHDPALVTEPTVWLDERTVARLRTLLTAYLRETRRGVDIERALTMALDVEASELEDVVVELMRVVRDHRWRNQAVQMLIHDLGDLSFMIEKYTHNAELLARADELVERRVGGLRAEVGAETGGPEPPAEMLAPASGDRRGGGGHARR